jgi:hypothetical protein
MRNTNLFLGTSVLHTDVNRYLLIVYDRKYNHFGCKIECSVLPILEIIVCNREINCHKIDSPYSPR